MEQNKFGETIRKQIDEIFQKVEQNHDQIPNRVKEILDALGDEGYDYFQQERPELRDELEAWAISLIAATFAPRKEIKNVLLGVVLATVYERVKEKKGGNK